MRQRTDKICEVHMTISIKEYVIRFNVSVNYVLAVDISQSTAQFSYPEPYGLLREGLSGDVKSQVAAIHKIDDEVSVVRTTVNQALIIRDEGGGGFLFKGTNMYSMS